MRGAPIIHSRTESIDFRDKLLAVPNDFTEEDIYWAKEYILSSTIDIDYLDGKIKTVIFACEKYIVIGITTKIKSLCSACGVKQDFAIKDKESRPVYAFIGYVFNRHHFSENFDIKPFKIENIEFLNIYNSIIETRWYEKLSSPGVLEPNKTTYNQIKTTQCQQDYRNALSQISPVGQLSHYSKENGCVYIIPNNEEMNGSAYYWVLAEVLENRITDISLCTHLNDINYVSRTNFSITSCTNLNNGQGLKYIKKRVKESNVIEEKTNYFETRKEEYGSKKDSIIATNDFKKIEQYEDMYNNIISSNEEEQSIIDVTASLLKKVKGIGKFIKGVNIRNIKHNKKDSRDTYNQQYSRSYNNRKTNKDSKKEKQKYDSEDDIFTL